MRFSRRNAIFCLLLSCAINFRGYSQEKAVSIDSITSLPQKYLSTVDARIAKLDRRLDEKTERTLAAFQKQENQIYKKLLRQDSASALAYLQSSRVKFQELQQKLADPGKLQRYIPYLDTLKTSFKFLESRTDLLSGSGGQGTSIRNSLGKIDELESSLQKGELVSQYLRERKHEIMSQLKSFGLFKDLKKLNKQVYYYSQQIGEYRQILQDPKTIERKALQILTKTKVFEDFMKRNSQLANLFRLPFDPNDPQAVQTSLAGLQTRAQVSQMIQQQVAAGGPNAQAQVQQNLSNGQAQLAQIKSRLSNFMEQNPSFEGDAEDIPDFKPNNQRTKGFWQRLELGTNMQSQRANGFLPVTSDLGLTLGYKLNNKSIVGLGSSYKIGWGSNIKQFKFSNEGVGFRSFLDWKIKGSLYASGGYEINYRSAFSRISELREYPRWQRSGLVGISKILSLNSKFFKKTKIQVLWDLLSYDQIPRTQPLLFRFGYNF